MSIGLTEAKIVAAVCRASFFEFVKEFWSVNISEKPVWNWHIPYLCGLAQAGAERVFAGLPKKWDYVINVSPASTKSTIFSVMFPAWVWTRMPHARFICGSYTHLLSLELSRKCREIVRSEKYQACFPEIQILKDQDTKAYFVNNRNGDRFAVGCGANVTGMHGHFLVVDDPMNPQAASSDEELAVANRWVGETLGSRKVDKEVAVMFLIMQRLHQNDPAGAILAKQKENTKHVCLPAEWTPDLKPASLARYYEGGLMDTVRLSRKVLADQRADLLEYGYACQFLQSPIPPGGGMFKTDRLLIQNPPKKFKRVVRFWDKAGTAMGGAFTVGTKMGMYEIKDNLGQTLQYYTILDIVRGQWDSHAREETIISTGLADGLNVTVGVEQEPGSGGKESAEATQRRLAKYKLRCVLRKPSGDKTVRADEFSKQVNAGMVNLAPGLWNANYLEEMRYFPHSTYKDQVDSSSGAFTECSTRRRVARAF